MPARVAVGHSRALARGERSWRPGREPAMPGLFWRARLPARLRCMSLPRSPSMSAG
ncbi:hypothetical protein F751_4327 [Auxenochlorella protothecoides]|uniref:Uncharacterized protein n=1 Tax=Auxenochlorella protothecoides TaxID=3075 RepID=A0A087SSZ8_AUXPR|nr:hypothetical protein F751_4327 [Auxenochlorella protothecoides]KFM28852.1 hypothetical protein F751_4327 [Auxenochlorella protothecoides]